MKFSGSMLRSLLLLTTAWPLFCLVAAEPDTTLRPEPDPVTVQLVPFLKKHCYECHNASDPKSGLDLTSFTDELSLLKHRQAWKNVQRMLRASEMPPLDKPQPSMEEREKIVGLIEATLNRVDCGRQKNPGRVTVRRLNRVEYNNTIRDLTGVQFTPADDFPADDIGYGFDHIGDVLSLPPVLFEKYLAAAEKIADAALREGDITNGPIRRFLSREMTWGGPGTAPNRGKYGRELALEGELHTEIETAYAAEYVANVRSFVFPKCHQPFKLELRIDGSPVRVLEYSELQVKTLPVRIQIPAGRHTISVAMIAEGSEPEKPPAAKSDEPDAEKKAAEANVPRLIFEYIDMQGPIDKSPTLSEQLILVCRQPHDDINPAISNDATCADEILREFIRRAFRRPVTNDDINPYFELYRQRRADGDNFLRGVKVAISAVLISPQFLFRIERDDETGTRQAIRHLDDFELATRLSYFLWSTMPDEELFEIAGKSQLRQSNVLRNQIRRMLADPQRQAFVENFAGQWLQLRNLEVLNPDKGTFPDFDKSLRAAMRRETELFFENLIHEDRSILDLLDSSYTFANERLANHYGLPGVSGNAFQKVSFIDDQRGGVLTQGSVLTVTSNPTRTSPVKRGKWVLENFLGSPPPPPPPMVEPLDESSAATSKGSLRERMEVHRSKAGCASCHQRMDPLGFGLENFDGIGRWRTTDGDFAIDASGDLPSGESFKSPKQLRGILLAHRDEFAKCLTEKMLTYGLGRGLEYYDKCAVDRIADKLRDGGYRFSVLIEAIVTSDPFQQKSSVTGT